MIFHETGYKWCEGCEHHNVDECGEPPSIVISKISLHKCYIEEVQDFFDEREKCDAQYEVSCLICKVSEKSLAKVKKVYSGEYFLVAAKAHANQVDCERNNGQEGREFMVENARTALKWMVMSFPTCEVVGAREDLGDGGIENISVAWVEEWLEHRALYIYYVLMEGELEKYNPITAKHPIGGITDDCFSIDNLRDRTQLEKVKGQLNEEQLKKLHRGNIQSITISC